MSPGPALLFCPGDRPDRYAKAVAAADTVIIDLEDAVVPDAKTAARQSLLRSELDPAVTIVRLNAVSTPEFDHDLRAVQATPYRTVMLAKAERPQDLTRLDGFEVIAICESPLGVRNAESLADLDNVVALTWGAEDLVAGLGGSSSRRPDGRFRDVARYARSRVLVAAASAGKVAYDTVHLDISDDAGLLAEAQDAAAVGFVGAMCIHPRQVEIIRSAFRPSADAVAWATAVLAAAAAAGNGVFVFQGRMVDEPVLRHARRILAAQAGAAPDRAGH